MKIPRPAGTGNEDREPADPLEPEVERMDPRSDENQSTAPETEERPEPAAGTPRPEPETPQSPSAASPDPIEPTGAETEDPARPVIDDPDASDLESPAATDPGRTTSDSTVTCPFCGERMELFLEPGGDRGRQEFVEECQACSRDFEVSVEYDDAGTPRIHTNRTQ